MRIIDADSAIRLLREYRGCFREDTVKHKIASALISILSDPQQTPTIDPDNLIPHGRWIEGKEIEEGTEIPMGVCSICGDSYNLEEFPFATLCDYFIYCPNCGAKMDKA